MAESKADAENMSQAEEHKQSGGETPEKHHAETTKAAVPDSKPRSGPGWFAVLILCLFFSVCSAVSSVYVYDRYFALKLVAVDIKGYLADQRDLYMAHKINEEQLNKAIDKLGAAVDRIPKTKAVVMADAVIRNVEVVKP